VLKQLDQPHQGLVDSDPEWEPDGEAT
jgi:hypothetical protein